MPGENVAFRWSDADGLEPLAALPGMAPDPCNPDIPSDRYASGVNLAGLTVGNATDLATCVCNDTGGSGCFADAVAWSPVGGINRLDDLLAAEFAAWTIRSAHGINDDGMVLATAADPADGESRRVLLVPTTPEICANGLDDDLDGFVDAADPDCPPLYVELESFSARSTPNGIVVQWVTVVEKDNVGFRVLREAGRGKVPLAVTHPLVPAAGTELSGAAYQFLDTAPSTATRAVYWLEAIDLFGEVTRFGPATTPTANGGRRSPSRE